MKKIIGMLILFTVVSILPFGSFANNGSWIYEDNAGIIWSFDESSETLTINGEGKMLDYADIIPYGMRAQSPAEDNLNIKHVVIEEGITYIGENSFLGCENIESISLPESLREIGDYAFCLAAAGLKELKIPAGVRKIGNMAFTPTEDWNIIRFYGNPPELTLNDYGTAWASHSLLSNFKGIIYHPCFASWSKAVKAEYEKAPDSDIIWKAWLPPVLDNIEEIFFDLAYGSWYIPAIEHIYNERVMVGTDMYHFSPNMKVTREQFIQILYNMSGAYYNGDTGFIDVPATHWAASSIKWAKENGITNGIGGDKFGIGQTLTREQLAVFLTNYAENIGMDTSKGKDIYTFNDCASVSTWALKGIKFCAEIGIIKGTDKKLLDPKGSASRAEVAQMISNFLYIKKCAAFDNTKQVNPCLHTRNL